MEETEGQGRAAEEGEGDVVERGHGEVAEGGDVDAVPSSDEVEDEGGAPRVPRVTILSGIFFVFLACS